MAVVAGQCGNEVLLWAHDPKVADAIAATSANPFYLPGVAIGSNVRATSSLRDAAEFSDTIFMVVPSHHYRTILEQLRPDLRGPVQVISGTKGIENESLDRMSEITAAVLGSSLSAMATLSGPTFAVEVARGDPTAAVVASHDVDFAQNIQML